MGAAEVQARRTRARTTAAMFFASLGLLIGASLGLGFLMGRASSGSVPSGPAPARVAEQAPAVGSPKTEPRIEGLSPPSKVNEGTLATTVDPSNTPWQALSPNVGTKESGAEPKHGAKSQPLAADTGPIVVGSKLQPFALEAKARTPVTILNTAGDPSVDEPAKRAQLWLKRAEEVRHQAEESPRETGKRLLLKIADTYERLAQLATEATTDEKPRRRHRSKR
jgi:hypothetical protein